MDKITVVTVCYNAETLIAETMRSVCEQDYPNVEYLVIDGKSGDGTVEIADKIRREYASKDTLEIQIFSEPDYGIYDAMNKGIKLAKGKWIIFMNAGDLFYSSTVLSEVFCKQYAPEISGVYGDTLRYHESWNLRVDGKPLEDIANGFPLPFCHQSVFVDTELMKKTMFDLRYKLAGDYNFFVQCYRMGCKLEHVPIIVSRYAMGGVSETNTVNHLKEKIAIREENSLEHFSRIKKKYLVARLSTRQQIKRLLPARVIKMIRGF